MLSGQLRGEKAKGLCRARRPFAFWDFITAVNAPAEPVTAACCIHPAASSARLTIGMRDALDVDLLHVGADIERIAVGDDHVRGLAHVERAELVADAAHLGRVQRDGLQRFVIGQAIGHRISCRVRQVARRMAPPGSARRRPEEKAILTPRLASSAGSVKTAS